MTYIRKLEIVQFGKFRGYEMEFECGYNEFSLKNEFGKTTLTDFIIFMLYGFPKKQPKDKTLQSYLLKKYLPWDGDERIAGAMEIVSDGRLYRIERVQKAGSLSKCAVRDSAGNEADVNQSAGEFFFGVDYDTFQRTFILRQSDMVFYKTDGIETALKNLVTTGDESVSFENALSALTKKRTTYQHSGRSGGLVYTLPKEIAGLEIQNHLLSGEDKKDVLFADAELEKEIENAELYQKDLENRVLLAKANDAARKLSRYRELEKEKQSLSSEAVAVEQSEAELYQAKKQWELAEASKQNADVFAKKASDALSEYNSCIKAFPEYYMVKENEQEIKRIVSSSPKINLPILLLALPLLICAVIFTITKIYIAGIISAILTVLSVIFAFVFRKKVTVPSKYGLDFNALLELYKKYSAVEKEIFAAETVYTKAKQLAEKQADEHLRLKALAQSSGFESKEQILEMLFAKKNNNLYSSRFVHINNEQKALLGGISVSELERLASGGDPYGETQEQAQRELASLMIKKQKLLKEKAELSGAVIKSENIKKQIFQNEQKINQLKAELENARHQSDVLTLAIDALSQAQQKINGIYSPILSEKAKASLMAFTDGKYDSLLVDKDFNILLRSESITRDLGYFSKGTQEAVYFALRNAVGEIISGKKALPLILDDPFWALDESRTQSARGFLRNSKRQLIIFTAK